MKFIQEIESWLRKDYPDLHNELTAIQDRLAVTDVYAMAIWYLRTRDRWTRDLESKLVGMCFQSEPCPDITDWSPDELIVSKIGSTI